MTRFKITAIAALFAASAVASGAEAHAHLTGAEPKAEAHMKGSPTAIRASFSEPLVAAFSGLDLTSNGAPVMIGKATLAPNDRHTLVAPIIHPLAPGDYVVHWHAVSADTHKTAGEYSFHVEP